MSRSTRTWARWAADDGARLVCAEPPRPSIGSCRPPKRSVRFASSSTVIELFGRADRPDDAVHDLQVGGRDLELLRRGRQEPLARGFGRALDRLADRVRDLRAAACRGVRRGLRVGVDDAHAVLRETEGLGGDRGEARVDAAHVGDAGDHDERAVGGDAADRGRGLVAARPVAERDPDALSTGSDRASARAMLAHAFEHLHGAHRRKRAVADARVALDRGVPQPQLDRIDSELGCELVHQRLERESGGRRSRGAVRAEGDAVRLDAVAPHVARLPPVRAGDEQRRDSLEPPAGVRAAIDDHPSPRSLSASRRCARRSSGATPARSAGLVAWKSSARVRTRRTGRPSASVAPATSGSTSPSLPPNAPPSGSATTRTRSRGGRTPAPARAASGTRPACWSRRRASRPARAMPSRPVARCTPGRSTAS